MNILIRAAALILCAMPAMAKEPSPDSDKQAVAGAVQQLHQAMIDANSSALYQLTVDELTFGHSSGLTEDRETFIKNVVTGKPDFKTIEFQEPDIKVKKDVAWVRGTFRADILGNAGAEQIVFKMLYVFVQENGAWKLLVRQAAK